MLKHLALVLAGAMILPAFATADIKMGVILGFTGPIESLTPDMGGSAEVAFKEASDSGFCRGQKIVSVRADSTCIDNAAATGAAERLVTAKVAGIMGADCPAPLLLPIMLQYKRGSMISSATSSLDHHCR